MGKVRPARERTGQTQPAALTGCAASQIDSSEALRRPPHRTSVDGTRFVCDCVFKREARTLATLIEIYSHSKEGSTVRYFSYYMSILWCLPSPSSPTPPLTASVGRAAILAASALTPVNTRARYLSAHYNSTLWRLPSPSGAPSRKLAKELDHAHACSSRSSLAPSPKQFHMSQNFDSSDQACSSTHA